MIDLVRICYRWVFALSLWLIVIGATIGGGLSARSSVNKASYIHQYSGGEGFSNYSNAQKQAGLTGAIFGLMGGFLVAVLVGGFVATLLKMDENLQYLADKEKAKG